MSPNPLVSVIIPTYQRAALVRDAVRSVLAQTYETLEVLVEDDGSTDGSEAAVASVGDARVSYAWAPNVGCPAPVRNRAMSRARGELVAFLDSDDVWAPGKLTRQIAALLGDPALLGVSCNSDFIPPRGRPFFSFERDQRPSFEDLVRLNVVLASGAVLRREALDAVGPFDEDPSLRGVEDYELWLRMLRHRDRSILVLREPLFSYRMSNDSISRWTSRQALELRKRAFAKHMDFRPDAIRAQVDAEEASVRCGELQTELREGTLALGAWLRAPEVPFRRRLRLAAKAVLLGRNRC